MAIILYSAKIDDLEKSLLKRHPGEGRGPEPSAEAARVEKLWE